MKETLTVIDLTEILNKIPGDVEFTEITPTEIWLETTATPSDFPEDYVWDFTREYNYKKPFTSVKINGCVVFIDASWSDTDPVCAEFITTLADQNEVRRKCSKVLKYVIDVTPGVIESGSFTVDSQGIVNVTVKTKSLPSEVAEYITLEWKQQRGLASKEPYGASGKAPMALGGVLTIHTPWSEADPICKELTK